MPQSDSSPTVTVSIEEALPLLGIGRTLGYEAARRGELPGCFRVGYRYRVSLPLLYRHLGLAWPPETAKADDGRSPEAA